MASAPHGVTIRRDSYPAGQSKNRTRFYGPSQPLCWPLARRLPGQPRPRRPTGWRSRLAWPPAPPCSGRRWRPRRAVAVLQRLLPVQTDRLRGASGAQRANDRRAHADRLAAGLDRGVGHRVDRLDGEDAVPVGVDKAIDRHKSRERRSAQVLVKCHRLVGEQVEAVRCGQERGVVEQGRSLFRHDPLRLVARVDIEGGEPRGDPGKRNGEEAVAAAEVNHFCFRLNAQPLQHFTRPRPQHVPPVRIRHGGGGKNPSNALTVFGRGTGNRRPRNAARSSRLRLPGRYRSAGRPSRQRSRYPPTSAARLHTADHRRFRQSRDRCFEQQPRARVVRSRCRQTPDDRPAAARDRFR